MSGTSSDSVSSRGFGLGVMRSPGRVPLSKARVERAEYCGDGSRPRASRQAAVFPMGDRVPAHATEIRQRDLAEPVGLARRTNQLSDRGPSLGFVATPVGDVGAKREVRWASKQFERRLIATWRDARSVQDAEKNRLGSAARAYLSGFDVLNGRRIDRRRGRELGLGHAALDPERSQLRGKSSRVGDQRTHEGKASGVRPRTQVIARRFHMGQRIQGRQMGLPTPMIF